MVQERDVTENGNGKGKKERLVEIVQDDGVIAVGHLPPINLIVVPSTLTKSATIRWLNALGYEVKEIYQFLGIRYQMVRNIINTIPKRAAREDLPPLQVRYKPEQDPIEGGLDAALDESLMQERRDRRKAARMHGRPTGNRADQEDEDEGEDGEDDGEGDGD